MWRTASLLFFFLLLPSLGASPQERWFLISDSELSTIETQKQSWEALVQSLQAQVGVLKTQLQTSQRESTRLLLESKSLNENLTKQRALNEKLSKSFNELEKEKSALISSLQSENQSLKQKEKELVGKLSWWRLFGITLAVTMLVGIAILVWQAMRPKIFRS